MRTLSKIIMVGCLLLGAEACTSADPPDTPSSDEGSTKGKKKTVKNSKSDSSDESDGGLSTEEGSSSESDVTKDESTSTAADVDPFVALLHADKLKSCHDEGKVYDRRTAKNGEEGTCGDAKFPSTFECTRAGIEGAFSNSANIKTYMDKQQTDGYEVDQCGTLDNGNPFVFFIKKDGAGETATILVRTVTPN